MARREPMERCSTEPSESGEIPQEELTAEERGELKGKKRARGDSAREVTIARMSVPQIKAELMAKGLSTSGLKRGASDTADDGRGVRRKGGGPPLHVRAGALTSRPTLTGENGS